MRKTVRIVLLLLVAILSATSILSLGQDRGLLLMAPSQQTFSQGGGLTYLPYLAKNYYHTNETSVFGVQTSDLSDTTTNSLIQQVGASWVRIGLSWSTLEPSNTTPGNFNWSAYDGGFADASAKGLLPLVTIRDNPDWAATTSCGPISPAYLPEFASFLSALVNRYSKPPYNAHYWEIYNEPDNTDVNRAWLGGCWGGKGKEYGDMLKIAYPAIKAADPNAEVMLGSLAYDWFTTDAAKGPFEERFLDDVIDPLKGNARAYFDLVGFHYYPAFRTRWETFGTDVMGKAKYLRDKLGNYGVVKSMAVTEINMWSGAAHGGSDELQSDYVVQAYARGIATDLVLLIWFTMVDYNDWEYGLLKQDLSQKQAYTAYKVMANMLNGYSYSGLFRYTGTKPVDVEGYTFTLPNGKERHTVWATVNDTRWVSFAGSKAVVTSKLGIAFELTDAEDGIPDGKVTFSVTQRPVYVDITP